ncbi:unnamed protein product [Pylaiella littoralis]
MLAAMDENFNPNRMVHGSNDALGSSSINSNRNEEAPVADGDAPLAALLGALEDGEVAVAGDLVAIRAGPETYHPIKALKGMASERDVIILSCLVKAPAAGETTAAVRSVLQRVIVRAPLAVIHNPGSGGLAAAGAAGGAGAVPNLRAISPSAHSAVIDNNLLRAFTATRARIILARLRPPAAVGDGTRELPTVVAGAVGGLTGYCFLGQRQTPEGFSSFSIRRESESEGGGQALRIDDLMREFGGPAHASVRALYDLRETSNGDVLSAALEEGAKASPFARLATEWDCSGYATRTLGSPPPPVCSSLLLVGGECPSSTVSLAIRGDIETLSIAATTGQPQTPQAQRIAKGPFGGGGGDTTASTSRASGDASPEVEQQERLQWDEDLQALLSGSENLAEFAARPRGAHARDGGNSSQDESEAPEVGEDTAVQERQDGGGLGDEENVGSGRQEEKFRGDLDFSEKLWEVAARAHDVESVRSAVMLAFDAVGEGQLFPDISRDNNTAAGSHLRDGVAMAQEARYRDGASVGAGVPRDEAKAKAWRERGSAMLADTETLSRAFVELGVHKVTRDLLHALDVRTGVLATDVDGVLPAATTGTSSDRSSSGDGTGDRRLDRLLTLADTLDLVALAQSYGAPWKQVQALAYSGLATLRRFFTAAVSSSSSSSPSPVFPVGLPNPIPPRARCKLTHPVFWELYLEPARSGGLDDPKAAGSIATSVIHTVSYTMATAGLLQLKGVDEPPMLSGGAARAALAALRGVGEHLIPEVLSSVAGVESFTELKRRQLELRAKGASAGGDATAVFVCEHRYFPC